MIEFIDCGGRPIVAKILVGSHNYNLNTEESDKDYKYFVYPIFEDLYKNKYYHHSNVSAECDYEIHDIRRLGELLLKSNPNYLEVLFSQECEWYDKTVGNFLLENRNSIAIMNLPRLWSAVFGLGCEKESKLEKGTSGTMHLVEKFGYDTKQAMHAYRAFELISKLITNHLDFGKSLWLDDIDRNFYLSIKSGAFTLVQFKEILSIVKQHALGLESFYKSIPQNVEIFDILNDFIFHKVKEGLINAAN